MKYIVPTKKTFNVACISLETAAKDHNFGILGDRDMKTTLEAKGKSLLEPCRIFDLCNPDFAEKLLEIDPSLSLTLPCRVSVFQSKGKVFFSMLDPADLVECLTSDKKIQSMAEDVRGFLVAILDQASKDGA